VSVVADEGVAVWQDVLVGVMERDAEPVSEMEADAHALTVEVRELWLDREEKELSVGLRETEGTPLTLPLPLMESVADSEGDAVAVT